MNIIIPLGGIGKRFHDNGYTKPKPLIKVLGKEIIFWLLDNLDINEDDNVFIPYNEFLDAYNFDEIVKDKLPKVNLLSLAPTTGPADTVKKCLVHFNIKGRIVLLDGDTWYEENILQKLRETKENLTVYFESKIKKPLFSYIKIENEIILEIAEKRKISDYANTGCYVFNSATKVLEYIKKAENDSEIYISYIIELMIKDRIVFKSIKAVDFNVLGTPQQIIEFSKSYNLQKKRFVFDLDNTLVSFPEKQGDYSTVKPIPKTINYLNNLKRLGHTIIIYTARRMRTHGGSVGKVISDIADVTIKTLKKYNINYDELYFGKPYGHFYIDDLMIDPKTDLNKELGFYVQDVEPRHFNNLVFEENSVIKTSKNNKLDGEAYFYNEIQRFSIKKYFPILKSSSKGRIEIERIIGSNFSTLYINEILNKNHIDKLIESINEIHNTKSNGSFNRYYDYNDKIINRFKEFDYDSINFDARNRQDLLLSVKNIKGDYKIIHGDLVFSNIILTNNGELKFFDVKGKLGNKLSIFGDVFYDYAKIYQSLIGYDEILLEKKIKDSYKSKLVRYFENKFTEKDLKKIKLITKSLLVSLIPLHNEKRKYKKYISLAKSII